MGRPRKSERPDRIQETIVEAATELFSERGYDAVSLAVIAEKVGIRAPSVAYHFGSKEKLYEQVVQRFYGDLAGVLAPLIGDAVQSSEGAGAHARLWPQVQAALQALPARERDLLVTITTELLAAGRGAAVIETALAPLLDQLVQSMQPACDERAPIRSAIGLLLFGAVLSLDSPRISPGLASLRQAVWGDGSELDELARRVLGSLEK